MDVTEIEIVPYKRRCTIAMAAIQNGSIFQGNPTVPDGAFPRNSGRCGQGTYLKILNGIYQFESGAFWPNLADAVVENYHLMQKVKLVEVE